MAKKLSLYFGIPALQLQKLGVFNAFIGLDNSLFVDPNLLKACKITEFQDARAALESYFQKIITLLKVSKHKGDIAWVAALKRLTFGEEHGAALGYSGVGGYGRAIGGELAKRLCDRAAEIIALGIEDPLIFELIPLFEDDFGPDRLSDMAVAILHERFFSYTQRVTTELNLKRKGKFRSAGKDWDLPINPDGKSALVFVPFELLNDLPVALDWSEITEVCEFNDEVRKAWSNIFETAAKQKRVPPSLRSGGCCYKMPKTSGIC